MPQKAPGDAKKSKFDIFIPAKADRERRCTNTHQDIIEHVVSLISSLLACPIVEWGYFCAMLLEFPDCHARCVEESFWFVMLWYMIVFI